MASISPDNIGIAFVYFSYKEREQQTTALVLCSLIHQLSSQLSTIPVLLESSDDKLSPLNKALISDEATAREVLLGILKAFKRVFFVFDALDEFDEEDQRQALIPIFHELGSSGTSVFVTSRPYPLDIVHSFPAIGGVVAITLAAQEEDLKIYIQRKIDDNRHARRLISSKVEEDISTRLVECAKGMFLLVHFFIEDICKQTTVNEIKSSMQNLDSSLAEEDALFDIYQRVIQDIKEQHKSRRTLALKSLSWAVNAFRALTIEEFCQAVSVSDHIKDIGPGDTPDISMILEVCGGLLLVDSTNGRVKPAHFSINEYLTGSCGAIPDAAKTVTTDCFKFLVLGCFEQPCLSYKEYRARVDLYPLWEYATFNLYNNVYLWDKDESCEPFLKFLGSPAVDVYIEDRRRLWRYQTWQFLPPLNPLVLPFSQVVEASYSGHVATFEYLCNGLQQGSKDFCTLLQAGVLAAVGMGNRDMTVALSRTVRLTDDQIVSNLSSDLEHLMKLMLFAELFGILVGGNKDYLVDIAALVTDSDIGAVRIFVKDRVGRFEEVTGSKLKLSDFTRHFINAEY